MRTRKRERKMRKTQRETETEGNKRPRDGGLPWWSRSRSLHLPMQGVQSLVGELRSHKQVGQVERLALTYIRYHV